MKSVKLRSVRLSDEDWGRLRRIAERMVADRRLAEAEQAAAMRLLIRDFSLPDCPVEDTISLGNTKQAT